jgi:hypothetical protein
VLGNHTRQLALTAVKGRLESVIQPLMIIYQTEQTTMTR